jgi:hypothetical protein
VSLRFLFIIAVFPVLATASSPAGSPGKEPRASFLKTEANVTYHPFLINSVFNYYGNNGDGSYNKYSTNNEGFEFVKGSGKTLVFEDGVIWGGYHKGRVIPKVGGSSYQHALQPGPITQYGTGNSVPLAADPSDPASRVYRVRPDVNPNVPFESVQDRLQTDEVQYISRYESVTARSIYDQYVKDWNEWPASLGAPFTYGRDANGRQRIPPAQYDPRFDVPGKPGADQTLWYVANDMDSLLVAYFTGSPPIGLEVQRTTWGYHRPGGIDQSIFSSTIMINKSGAPIDTMYFGQWSDPDIGNGGDDLVGCDTTRDMGYAYNGSPTDAVYGASIPAAGFLLLQGPLVPSPSDTAVFNLKRRVGWRNLRMSSFTMATAGYVAYVDPVPGFGGDVEWYQELQGHTRSGAPFIDPLMNLPTKFPLSGDPVTKTGWYDGLYGLMPNDRRLMVSAGPLTMAAGDTQEIVVATVAGLGADYISSVTVLRAMADKDRLAYGSLLGPASPPAPPNVSIGRMDGEIILTWGDPSTIAATEMSLNQGYAFEGYNVYEYGSPSGLTPFRLATYDLVDGIKAIVDTVYDESTGFYLTNVIQRGTDSGILHSIDIKKSAISGLPLANGNPYYFGVTAYSYSAGPSAITGSHSLESSPEILTVIPQSTNPGTRFNQSRGDSIPVTVTVAPGFPPSDGQVVPSVIDPTRITGDTYAVTFANDTSLKIVTWGVRDQTKNKSLVSGLTNQKGGSNSPIVDGIQIEVYSPPPGMKTGDQYSLPGDSSQWGWYIPTGSRWWTPSGSDIANSFHLEGFNRGGLYNGAIGNAYDHWYSGGVTYDRLANVLLKFAATDSTWNPTAAPTDPNFSRGYRYVRHAADTSTYATHPGWSALIPNRANGYAYQDYNYSVPFSAWNVDATPPVRLAVGHLENNANGGFVDGKWWPPSSSMNGVDQAGTQREWFFIFAAPYTDPAPNPALTVDVLDNTLPIMWCGIPDRTVNTVPAGDEFMIVANHANGPADTYSFTPKAPTVGDPAIARADVTKINVFPNPFQSFDPGNPTRFTQVVTFTHLPQRAIIRIYTLAGIMVKSILKDDPGQFLAWDMKNDRGSPVASGMYLVFIQMPDLGSTKTLKLGILAEKQ